MKILIGSNNIGKIKEYRRLLCSRFDLVSPKDLGLEFDVEETGETYEENALLKLNFLRRQTRNSYFN